LAENGDFPGITAKRPDVILDPLQGKALIQEAKIEAIIGNNICSSYNGVSKCNIEG
jgi:hypothetical protein